MAGPVPPSVYVVAGSVPERTEAAALLVRRLAGALSVAGDVSRADAAAAAGGTVVLEVDVPAGALGPLRTSIRHRPCHVVVVAADAGAYAGDADRVGVWLDPADDVAGAVLRLTQPDPDPILIADPDPAWAVLFAGLAATIRPAVRDIGAQIEHVGSTAVPALAAKPIVDIDVVVPSQDDVPMAIDRLRRLGYVYQGDKGIPGREAFLWPPDQPRHHLYVVVDGSPPHRAHVRFRDILREHPDLVREYARLKRALAARHASDRVGYTDAKSAFVARVLADADPHRP